MKETSPINEAAVMAEQFCKNNTQTAFLLRRIKAHESYIYDHAVRTAFYALLLAQGLGLSAKEQEVLYRSALLQDIGKLRVSSKWAKNGEDDPKASLLDHPTYSVEVLAPLIARGLVDGDAVLQHHENLDGSGYPNSRTWEDITLNARILHVADSFAAITFYDRRTKQIGGIEQALEELYRWNDMLYDADLVELLFSYYGAEVKPAVRHSLRLINH